MIRSSATSLLNISSLLPQVVIKVLM
jgi:hypothetical protein